MPESPHNSKVTWLQTTRTSLYFYITFPVWPRTYTPTSTSPKEAVKNVKTTERPLLNILTMHAGVRRDGETGSLKPCPHCRRKVRLSPKTARKRRQSPNSATVALFCDSVDWALYTHGLNNRTSNVIQASDNGCMYIARQIHRTCCSPLQFQRVQQSWRLTSLRLTDVDGFDYSTCKCRKIAPRQTPLSYLGYPYLTVNAIRPIPTICSASIIPDL